MSVGLKDRIRAVLLSYREHIASGHSLDGAVSDICAQIQDQELLKTNELYYPDRQCLDNHSDERIRFVDELCKRVEVNEVFKIPYNLVAYVAQETLIHLSKEILAPTDKSENLKRALRIITDRNGAMDFGPEFGEINIKKSKDLV